MYYLGKASKRRINPVNNYWKLIIGRFLKMSPIDITIPWMGGLRTAEEQKSIFDNGYSQRDGYNKKSFHQSGDALDVAPYKNGGMNSEDKNFLIVAKYMLLSFNELKKNEEIPEDIYLHCGCFWATEDRNDNGILEADIDKMSWDQAHYELRSSPQKNVLKL